MGEVVNNMLSLYLNVTQEFYEKRGEIRKDIGVVCQEYA